MKSSLDDLDDLINCVGAHTAERGFDGTEWERVVGVNGLIRTEKANFIDSAQELIDHAIRTQTGEGQFLYGGTDPVGWSGPLERWTGVGEYTALTVPAGLGSSVLEIYERTGEERYLKAAQRQYEFFDEVPRTADKGIPIRKEVVELWIDSTYMICPFFAFYGNIAGNEEAHNEAVRQLRVHADHLQSDLGLFRHIWREEPNWYPQSQFWARGNGWAGAALVETIERLPDGHDGQNFLTEILHEFATEVIKYQDGNGFWHNVIDDPRSPLETSGTLGIAYALKRGVDLGILDAEPYNGISRHAVSAAFNTVEDDGRVTRVAHTPGGPGASLGSLGPGWFLLAASSFS